MQWILASASPRRKELFAELIKDFEIIPAKGEEAVDGALSPKELVRSLAYQKAKEVAERKEAQGKGVVGADTVVAFQGQVLGKPKDEADAVRMLSMLSGNAHQVYTGVCILYPKADGTQGKFIEADCTQVFFEELNADMVASYVKTGSPMDKAGAYGIQDGGLVRSIEGSFSNVVGFPLELVRKMLETIKKGQNFGGTI